MLSLMFATISTLLQNKFTTKILTLTLISCFVGFFDTVFGMSDYKNTHKTKPWLYETLSFAFAKSAEYWQKILSMAWWMLPWIVKKKKKKITIHR